MNDQYFRAIVWCCVLAGLALFWVGVVVLFLWLFGAIGR